MIILLYPWLLFLLLLPFICRKLLPPAKGVHGDALRVPFLKDVAQINIISGSLWRHGSQTTGISHKFVAFFAIWTLLVLAATRPQWVGEPVRVNNYGRDIMMVTDISTSMLEPDFAYANRRIDRLTAVKLAAEKFIRERTNDRIGLILFATRAYLQTPITFDKKAVSDTLWSADAGMAGNSTAIGDAVGLALKNMRGSKNSRIMILLTDGENNDGSLSMAEALKLARDENIKIYTIGVGSEKQFVRSFFGMKVAAPTTDGLDEQSLKQLAEETKGRYFKASNTASLQKIYDEIDRMEPNLDEEQYIRESKDLFHYPLAAALIAVIVLLKRQRRKSK